MSSFSPPSRILEKYLQPGEVWIGDEHTRIRTLLGSCVAVTLWHPRYRVGGMCHFMMPGHRRGSDAAQDGRFCDDALEMLLDEMDLARSRPHEYEVKLFGGGHMFQQAFYQGAAAAGLVPDRNVSAGRELVHRHGFRVKAEQLGGEGHRQIVFDIWSGDVWVKHASLPQPLRLPIAEGVR